MTGFGAPDRSDEATSPERQRQAEQERDQGRERTRQTTFGELIRYCHDLFSRPLTAETPSRSTTGKIPPHTGKCCPLRLLPRTDFAARQQKLYRSVRNYLEPPGQAAARLFSPHLALEDLGQRFSKRTISSEQDLESYDDLAWRIMRWSRFDNHANALDAVEADQPDQFCIRLEYKPHPKLSVENLRAGLRPMDFWEVEYNVMIQEGLGHSYLTNGFALVLLRVPYDEPGTLYYHLCEPNMGVDQGGGFGFPQRPVTAIARVLCLCLMSFRSQYRGQEWRNAARAQLPVWKTSFDHTPGSEYAASDFTSSEPSASEYLPSSCAPPNSTPRDGAPDSDADSAPGRRKRGCSQDTSSPSRRSLQRSARHIGPRHAQSGEGQQHTAVFCTQRCLLGLQQGGQLDNNCPNVMLHRQGGNGSQHLINTDTLAQRLKQQLDENIDRDCTPGGLERLLDWDVVSREVEVYRVLRRTQGSAVPVFLGAIDLAKFYFLHGAGEIRHMLIMGWGGDPIHKRKHDETVEREIARSEKEIRSLGVLHQDVRPDIILWNDELRGALIIDFHCPELDYRPMTERTKLLGKHACGAEVREQNRLDAAYR
ncbi:hypothetical protein BDV10DRAFT_192049 [Aspergillus recurvatus]